VQYVPGSVDILNGGTFIVLAATGACINLTDTLWISIGQVPVAQAGPDVTLTGGATAGETVQMHGDVLHAAGGTWTSTGTGTFSPDDSSLSAIYTPSTLDY